MKRQGNGSASLAFFFLAASVALGSTRLYALGAAVQATLKNNASVAGKDATNGVPPPAWKILSQVGNRYADLKTYRFTGIDEATITIAKSTYRFTSHVEIFSAGTSESTGAHYDSWKVEKPAGTGSGFPPVAEIRTPYQDVYAFGKLPENALSAQLVGEDSLEANGKNASCYIIELRWRPPVNGRPPITQNGFETLWVDKLTGLVLRARFNKFNDANVANPHLVERWSTTFSSYQLNGPQPDWARTAKQRMEEQDRALSARMTGRPAPAFTLNDLNGHSISLGSLRGKIVLIDFWATWCGPCKEEEPILKELEEDFGTGSLAILRVTDQSTELVRRYLQRIGVSFPTLVDGEKVSRVYEVRDVPTLVVINRAGKITSYNVGFLSESNLKADLKQGF